MSKLGNRIRQRRHDLGLTQEDISSEEVSAPYISRIETGDISYPSPQALMAIADKLETTALELETGTSEGACPYCGRTGK